MRKILVIKDGLSTGGTTSSFLAFLNAMKFQTKYELFVWINEAEEKRREIPNHVQVYFDERLDKSFRRPQTIAEKVISLARNRQLFLYLKMKLLGLINQDDSRVIRMYQLMDIRSAKKQDMIKMDGFDAVITWEEFYPCYLLAETIQTYKKIAWIHPDYIQCGFDSKYDKPSFAKLDAIVAVSEKGRESLTATMSEYAQKFYCVENCVNVDEVRIKAKEPQNDMLKEDEIVCIVTVARLQNISKALDRAVRIASNLKSKGYSFKWFFVGNGEDYNRMQAWIIENDVSDCVILLGHKDNPYPYIANADLFVLQSYYEGKPVVVDESLILGTPVLVSNYAAAQEQVPKDCGWIADNNEEDICKKLEEVIRNRDEIISCRERLSKLDMNHFMDCSSCVNMLDEVLNNDCKNI